MHPYSENPSIQSLQSYQLSHQLPSHDFSAFQLEMPHSLSLSSVLTTVFDLHTQAENEILFLHFQNDLMSQPAYTRHIPLPRSSLPMRLPLLM